MISLFLRKVFYASEKWDPSSAMKPPLLGGIRSLRCCGRLQASEQRTAAQGTRAAPTPSRSDLSCRCIDLPSKDPTAPKRERVCKRRSLSALRPILNIENALSSRFLLRYYPPGIILEHELRDGTREMKEIDLLHLTAEFITGSYDRTCKVWDTQTGDKLLTLEGHKNVVYAIAFNNPYGDKIITGQLYHTYRGHSTEIVCLSFNPQGTVIATGSMDNTAKLWDVETGQELHTLFGHTAEIVSLNFDTQGERIITGSFDHTVKVWDVRSGRCIHTLAGHHGEISSTQFNYTGELCISGSIDRTCKIWDVASGQNVQTLRGHNDEILDVSFNATGSKLVTASADGTSRIYNTMTGACQAILIGHEAEISKVCFNPQGSKVLTASSDKVARLWEVETGDCLQMLEGHTDEIFSCAFNYEGDTIITGAFKTIVSVQEGHAIEWACSWY
ncbi:Wd domain-containing protein, partial [Globisporangium splendens]